MTDEDKRFVEAIDLRNLKIQFIMRLGNCSYAVAAQIYHEVINSKENPS
jgi:hypothetical protein